MPIDLTTPTVRPPTSLDLDDGEVAKSPTTTPTVSAPESTFAGMGGESDVFAGMGETPYPTTINTSVNEFAQNAMANPSRYDIDLVGRGIGDINAAMEESSSRGLATLDERMSQRGLVGSSTEATATTDFLGNLERTKSERMTNLAMDMAQTFAQDRAGAGQLGVAARSQELQATGMAADDAYRYAVLEQGGTQFSQELEQQESQFARQYGLSGQDLQLRASEIEKRYALENRSLDVGEAQFQAEIELRGEQLFEEKRQFDDSYTLEQAKLDAENEQFDLSMNMARDQFAEQLGFSREELDQQNTQFQAGLQDSRDARMFQMDMQQDSQEWAAAEAQMNRAVEYSSLELQRAGLDAESAWREADRNLDRELESRVIDLQEQAQRGEYTWTDDEGNEQTTLTADEAYRQALLGLDRENLAQRKTESEQSTALSLQDMYLRALSAGAGDDLEGGLPFPGGDYWQNYFGKSNYPKVGKETREGTGTVTDGTGTGGTGSGGSGETEEEYLRRVGQV